MGVGMVGRPGLPREVRQRFWVELGRGGSVAEAAARAGVKRTAAANWVRKAGGMIPSRRRVASNRLSSVDREEIAFARTNGESMRSIAARLGRAPSTISREIRAGTTRRGYRPLNAEQLSRQREARPRGGKLATSDRLRDYVQTELEAKHSPEQISLRLRREFPDDLEMRVSHETIYQALYVEGRGGLRRELVAALRTGRTLRKTRGRTSNAGKIPNMVMIADRPDIEDRVVPGHWEGDLITGAGNKSAIGTLVERTTGFLILLHLPDRHGAEEVRDQMITAIRSMRRSHSRPGSRSISATHTRPGSAARTRTRTGYCGNTFRKARTSPATIPTICSSWPTSSTTGHANDSTQQPQQKP